MISIVEWISRTYIQIGVEVRSHKYGPNLAPAFFSPSCTSSFLAPFCLIQYFKPRNRCY